MREQGTPTSIQTCGTLSMSPLLLIHPSRNSIPINDDIVIRTIREKGEYRQKVK